MRRLPTAATALGSLALASGLLAQQTPNTTLYSNTPGAPTSLAPGLGAPFDEGSLSTSAFFKPYVSPTGVSFGIEADLETSTTVPGSVPSTANSILIVNGAILLQEGNPAPGVPGRNIGLLDDAIGLNDLGEIFVTFDLDGSTTDDEVAVFFDAMGTPTLVGQDASPIPGLGGPLFGSSFSGAQLNGLSQFIFESDDFSTGSNYVLRGTGAAGVTGVVALDTDPATAPTGLAGGATDQWENFDFNAQLISEDGLTIVLQGDTDGTTSSDDILTVNGAVVLQEGQTFGTFASGVSTIGWRVLDPLGNLIVRGENSDGTDWLLRNGTVVAQGGDPVLPGSTELLFDGTGGFSDTFFSIGGNLAGQFAFGATTDNPDQERNAVYVLDDGAGNRRIIAREGDPVDVDGNGLFDDDRFFDTFGNDDIALGLTQATIVATLKDGDNNSQDQAVVQIPIGGPLARFYPSGPVTAMAPPLSVTFVGEASSSVGPVTYAWDFDNDGTTDSTSPNPTFNFVNPGNYTVTLTVDDGVTQGVATAVDLVRIDNVTASFTATPTAGTTPLMVNFTDTSAGMITGWAWDLDGNGTIDSTAQNPSFTYTAGGTYDVSLTVSNAFGSDTFTATNLIQVLAPTENTESAEILSYQFNEVRGGVVANTASTTSAPAFGTVLDGDGWQTDPGRAAFSGNEPGAGALGFDTSRANGVDTGWPLNLTSSYTFMWWQRQQGTSGNPYVFATPTGIGNLRIWLDTVSGAWSLRDWGGANFNANNTAITDGSQLGVWNHCAVVVDVTSGTATWYVNGAVDATTTFAGPIALSDTDFYVGSLSNSTTSILNDEFDLDDFRLYARALSQMEVQTAMMSESPTTSNYGTGCAPGGGAVPSLRGAAAPQLGNAGFGVELSGFAPSSPITLNVGLTTVTDPLGGLPLPFDLGAVLPGFFAGCVIEVPLATALGFGADGAGNALLPIPVPADPALAGAHIYMQAYGLNGSGFSFTEALDINFQN
jgi:PKD repeat protein